MSKDEEQQRVEVRGGGTKMQGRVRRDKLVTVGGRYVPFGFGSYVLRYVPFGFGCYVLMVSSGYLPEVLRAPQHV